VTENRRLLTNSFFLGLVQLSNFGLPLITFPYLVRTLGMEMFGLLALVNATVYYTTVVIDYGFNLTATREVARYKGDKDKLSNLFFSILIVKFFLIVVCSVLIFIIEAVNSFVAAHITLFWIVFLGGVASSLFPTWFFQGLEQMKLISLLNVFVKLLFTVSVFIFIQDSSDYILVPGLSALGAIAVLFIGWWVVFRYYEIKFYLPSFKDLQRLLADGVFVFLSQLKISLFSNTNYLILGLFSGPVVVGYYAAAEKMMRALALAQTPVTNALFPQIADLIQTNPNLARLRLKKIALLGVLLYTPALVFLYVYAQFFVSLLFGLVSDDVSSIFRILVFIPIFIFLNNISGTQILLNMGKEKIFFFGMVVVAAFSLISCFLFAYFFKAFGVAISLFCTEFLLMVLFGYFSRKFWMVKK
jgi:PST family polysaccharide transporter